ncbi:MAG TPA: hypothetical protein VMV18_06815, partial [bacterium]|nr:hypothetical protein [bacterium]
MRTTIRTVAAAVALAGATACAHRPPEAGPRPDAKPAARIEFDSGSGDIFYVPAMIPAGYSRLEATWRGRELFVIARPVQGKRRVFWKMIPPYVNFQVRNQLGTQYFGAGKRTISINVFDDGSEIALVAVAGSRRTEPRAESLLGKFFAEQVKDAMSGGGQE